MKQLFVVLLVLLIIVIGYNKYQMIWVHSTSNKKKYLLKRSNDPNMYITKANILANLDTRVSKLIHSLPKDDIRTQRLLNKKIRLQERSTNSDIGYTINKGETIGLCIEDDINTLMFICIHEIAHVCTKSVGHTKQFWENFKYILEIAIKINVYNYNNYNVNPKTFCKSKINFTPI